ncbi:MAG: 50S ribosomal protein L11 methyltransferase [Anaerolineales bacterium]|nr:50S ribosomal protein L11 methyltransferase [Anaerolineales bacterium]
MDWLEISVATDGEAAEAVAEMLRPFAYQDGVVLEQLGDETSAEPDALLPTVSVKIYVPGSEDTPALRRRIEENLYHMNRLYPVPAPVFKRLADQDWANAWKAHYHPFRIGKRLWIQPSWRTAEQDAADPDADIILTLDPGMAFGTGTHPTTQMCLELLEELVQPGVCVLDVGTGSGILAVAAAKLGAETVWGIDTDELAVRAATENAAQNGVTLTVWRGMLPSVERRGWDLVVVNILAPVIVALLRDDGLLRYVAPGGRLILSGIIDTQAEMVETAVHAAGGVVHAKVAIRDWLAYAVGPSAA